MIEKRTYVIVFPNFIILSGKNIYLLSPIASTSVQDGTAKTLSQNFNSVQHFRPPQMCVCVTILLYKHPIHISTIHIFIDMHEISCLEVLWVVRFQKISRKSSLREFEFWSSRVYCPLGNVRKQKKHCLSCDCNGVPA